MLAFACALLAPCLVLSQSCSSHDQCSSEISFCYEGGCSSCDECHFCDDGVDGTCGTCGDGYPTQESGNCSDNDDDDEEATDTSSSISSFFKKHRAVFGIDIFGTASVADAKFDHAANVLYQYLDNDEDGVVDDADMVAAMVEQIATLVVFYSEAEAEQFIALASDSDRQRGWQDLYDSEIVMDSCSLTPSSERDASSCSTQYDATLEEVLHLVTSKGVSVQYAAVWAESYDSVVGQLLSALNGDCGWGYSGDWKDPNSDACDGVYAYDDATCGESCVVAEGIYWALTSVLGSQNYSNRAESIANEWLLAYPANSNGVNDTSTACEPQPHCRLLEEYAPSLYELLTNHSASPWLPRALPDGNYSRFPNTSITSLSGSPTTSPTTDPDESAAAQYACLAELGLLWTSLGLLFCV